MYKIILLFLLFINSYASQDNCLFMSYNGNGTCETMTSLLEDNEVILQVRKDRNNVLKRQLANILKNKALVVARDIAKEDQLSKILNDKGLAAIPECNLSNFAGEMACGDDENFQDLFPGMSKDIFAETLMSQFRGENLSGSIGENNADGQCISGALKRNYSWAKRSIFLEDSDNAKKLYANLVAIKAGSDRILYNDLEFLEQYYPNIIKDLSNDSFKLPKLSEGESITSFLSTMMNNNKSIMENRIKKQCENMKKMIIEGVCSKLVGSKLNNTDLSSRFFGYSTEFQQEKFDDFEAELAGENVEESFRHFVANCSEDACSSSCIQFEDFFNKHEVNQKELEILSNGGTDLRESAEKDNDRNLCRTINCKNFEEMMANETIACQKREGNERNIVNIAKELNCKENPNQEVCEYIVIVTKSRTVTAGKPVISEFARSVLGETISTTIITNTTDTTNITSDIGIDEDEVNRFDESVSAAAEESVVNSNKASQSRKIAINKSKMSGSNDTRSSSVKTSKSKKLAPRSNIRDRRISSARSNQDIAEETQPPEIEQPQETEEDLSEEETSLIGSLRDAISNTIGDIGKAAKSAVTPKTKTVKPAVNKTTARLGEVQSTPDPRGNPAADSFNNESRTNTLAGQPGDTPEGLVESLGSEVISGDTSSIATVKGSKAASKGQSRGLASTSNGAQNTGYKPVDGDLLQSITLTAGELETLDEAQILGLNIPVTEPFVILVKVNGQDVPVKVRRISQDGNYVLRPIIDESNQVVEDQLRKAPVFANYFNSPVMRKSGLDAILDNN